MKLQRTLVFQLDWIVISRSEDKNHGTNLGYADSLSSRLCHTHTDKIFVPLYTGLLEKWEFQITSVMRLIMQCNPELGGRHSQPKDRRTVDTFFNTLQKIATESDLTDAPGNIFNADESGIQINQKPDSLKAENRSKYNLITVQQHATYSVYYISVGSSTIFGCWHPSSGARTTVITVSGID